MSPSIRGLHHVTAIAGDPQENLDFYVGVLGLRLVKRSVNQDVPGSYHLFYADAVGTPGTDVTFFPWPDLPPARPGTGHATGLAFAVPPGTLGAWRDRLEGAGVEPGEPRSRFGETGLPFRDPHGLPLELLETPDDREWTAWGASPVPEAEQLRGMHAVRVRVREAGPTRRLFEEGLGFRPVGEEEGWTRFAAAGGGSGTLIDLREDPGVPAGRWGTGGIHHVAWRVADEREQEEVRDRLREAGVSPTPPIDRFWFRSVYFREPGGVLFELATEGPGFDRDEAADALGETLVLPPWLESRRVEIEAELPPLTAPARAGT